MHKYMLQLDLQLFAQEKTEKATPRKRQDARKKGQVAKSSDLPGALVMFFSFLGLFMLGGYFEGRIHSLFTVTFNEYMRWNISMDNMGSMFGELIFQGMLLIAPILIIALALGIFGNYIQVGLLFTGEPLKMKLNKLDPIQGAKRIFSIRALIEFLKSTLKFAIVALVVVFTLYGENQKLVSLSQLPLDEILRYTAQLTAWIGVQIGAVLVILALFDYLYQRYDHNKQLRMSKQEVKDEFKKTEGDPLIKSRIRAEQRRMAMARMMQEVPNADVIITNPTHYAVALQYDATVMEEPKVIAKGADYLALKIREVAEEHDIIMMENKPLARALYDQVDIGQSIPADLFQAVAEVLAYVYKVRGKR